ncbi:hypothetical protein ACHAXA_004672 [Cyclostephanos tholiformis]|uniref:Protein root UVB sensitive/RUS domain-containing protein n=1 Tax=Cyclostephanos tholiformis TaxID=382380 RepID=A0ABD3R495_9STRA
MVANWLGSSDVRTAIGLYCLLTLLHLLTNHQALKLVALDWLNDGRLHLVVEEFLKYVQDGGRNINEKLAKGSIDVSNPVEVSRKESLFFLPKLKSTGKQTLNYPIRMGISFNEFSDKTYMAQSLLRSNLMKKQNQRQDSYMLSVGRENRRSDTKLSILVSYFSTSNNSEKAKVYLHCCLISRALASLKMDKCDAGEVGGNIQKAELLAKTELDALWPIFERSVTAAGWKLDKTECFTEGYELYFDDYNMSRD